MPQFRQVMIVGRNRAGEPVVYAKKLLPGGAAALHTLLVPDYTGSAREAQSLAAELAEKFSNEREEVSA